MSPDGPLALAREGKHPPRTKELSQRAVRAARLGAAKARHEVTAPLRSRGFPYVAPGLPRGVEPIPTAPELGIHYDTAWARKYPARLARALVVDGLGRPFVYAMSRPTVKGLDRLENVKGPVIFAANHLSHADTGVILASLPDHFRHRTVVAAGADYFFDHKWKAHTVAFLLNAVPIERHKISFRSATLPIELVNDGWSLLIYPEGGRSPDGWSQPHRPGAAFVAKRTGAKVVPVHVSGTRLIMQPGKGGLRPGKATISFGKPLRLGADEDARDFSARIERTITVLADEHFTDWWSARLRAGGGEGETLSLSGPQGVGEWRRSWAMSARVAWRKQQTSTKRSWPKL